ncbi:hypothetical protein SISSUDRAFT_1065845 [Sistotremastrum suecicum HHB10207 ss-3]|uniref:Uncharacterized protein n=1 Tax=Sistotremastrum suecicum HHB10207 ss-3 TaxID=1314776 RepID=A0A165Z0W5_9AGAM|nr:hypothetical protein SISSUDRAFT_1065845 [Sistotremastrum suecicum HHB10207 ss-3]
MDGDFTMHPAHAEPAKAEKTNSTRSSRFENARQATRFRLWLHRKMSPDREIASAARREAGFWRQWVEQNRPSPISGSKRKHEDISELSYPELLEEARKADIALTFRPAEKPRIDTGRQTHIPWSPWTLSVDYKFSDAEDFPGSSGQRAVQLWAPGEPEL